jgi:hypothetical protein
MVLVQAMLMCLRPGLIHRLAPGLTQGKLTEDRYGYIIFICSVLLVLVFANEHSGKASHLTASTGRTNTQVP